jgi:hypothetical protein
VPDPRLAPDHLTAPCRSPLTECHDMKPNVTTCRIAFPSGNALAASSSSPNEIRTVNKRVSMGSFPAPQRDEPGEIPVPVTVETPGPRWP